MNVLAKRLNESAKVCLFFISAVRMIRPDPSQILQMINSSGRWQNPKKRGTSTGLMAWAPPSRVTRTRISVFDFRRMAGQLIAIGLRDRLFVADQTERAVEVWQIGRGQPTTRRIRIFGRQLAESRFPLFPGLRRLLSGRRKNWHRAFRRNRRWPGSHQPMRRNT